MKHKNHNRRGRNFKEVTKTPEELREEIFKEINSHPIDINRTVFAKTPLEREKLRKLKNRYKLNNN